MSALVAKRAFLAGVTCRTQGWYVHHAPPEVPGPGLQWRFWIGADVHDKAREWLGTGTMLRRTPLEAALADSQDAVRSMSDSLLYEVSFSSKGLVARADAIRAHGSEWDLIEIKSGSSPEDGEKVDREYVDDLAYTHLVATNAGLRVARSLLVLINREYRLNGTAEMFAYVDLTEQVKQRASEFALIAEDIVRKASGPVEPQATLIFDCKKCDWFDTECVGRGIPDPLFVIPRISAKKFDALKEYERVSRLPADADLTETQQAVVDVIRSGKPKIDYDGLRVLDAVQYPVRYLDFEALAPHLPWFDDVVPYEMIPFQYSLHTVASPGATATHKEYLAPLDGDWRCELIDTLLNDLGADGPIVVYSGFEKGRLRLFAQQFPEYAARIDAVVGRLFDLEAVFKKGYQHPGFLGRTSIKKVLPVVVTELSYKSLQVNNGDDALGVFGLMRTGQIDEQFVPTHRERLLEYCKLDTYAMVKLHEAIGRIASAAIERD